MCVTLKELNNGCRSALDLLKEISILIFYGNKLLEYHECFWANSTLRNFNRAEGSYYCSQTVSFLPKSGAYYTADQYVKEKERTCYVELLEKVKANGKYIFKLVASAKSREGTAPFMDSNGPWCKPYWGYRR